MNIFDIFAAASFEYAVYLNLAAADLSAWALPEETIEQTKARNVLWRFAVQWWSCNIAKEAIAW